MLFLLFHISASRFEKMADNHDASEMINCSICGKAIPRGYAKQGNRCLGCDIKVSTHGNGVIPKINNLKYCQNCFNIKPPVGDRRSNGKEGRIDWDAREYCTKCWKQVKDR